MAVWAKRVRRVFDDANYLVVIDRAEQQLAKLLGLVLVVVMLAATVQLVDQVVRALMVPGTPWLGDKLNKVLGDLLNLLIALEVLQNITSYLRRHVVQIELVLLTAMTAVARKVIVLPAGAESKPQLLAGLGVAVLALAAPSGWCARSRCRSLPPEQGQPYGSGGGVGRLKPMAAMGVISRLSPDRARVPLARRRSAVGRCPAAG
jgi:uncharacterized membrane protein (DUF373 family)